MDTVRLKTFQPLARLAQWGPDELLVSEWSKVGGPLVIPAYQTMVARMAAHGIDCSGRPPIWAWKGTLTFQDASDLLNVEHQLSHGWATVTFDAPSELVLLTDYAHWCQYLFGDAPWTPDQPTDELPSHRTPPLQATLPYVARDWVHQIVPFPTGGWESLNPDTEV